jgi:hypothetical protein
MVGKKSESNIHLYLVQIQEFDNFVEEGDRWALIKYKVKLVAFLDEKQTKQIWELFDEFHEVFAWHKGELMQCSIEKHSIDTQGLPPCCVTPSRLSY